MTTKFDKQLSQVVDAEKVFEMTQEGCIHGYNIIRGKDELNWQTLKNFACSTPRFFRFFIAPYTSYTDFGLTLAYAGVGPLAFGIVASAATITAAAGAMVAFGSLIITGSAALAYPLTKDTEFILKPADLIVYGALAAIVSTVIAVLANILAPLAVAALLTRSIATLASSSVDFFSKRCDKQGEDKPLEDDVHPQATL